jgi:hypothetical protein
MYAYICINVHIGGGERSEVAGEGKNAARKRNRAPEEDSGT